MLLGRNARQIAMQIHLYMGGKGRAPRPIGRGLTTKAMVLSDFEAHPSPHLLLLPLRLRSCRWKEIPAHRHCHCSRCSCHASAVSKTRKQSYLEDLFVRVFCIRWTVRITGSMDHLKALLL